MVSDEVRVTEPLTTFNRVVIRNLKQVPDTHYSAGYGYTFQAQIDGKWYECSGPTGNWSYVDHHSFSVKVGWWELDEIYHKRGRYAGG